MTDLTAQAAAFVSGLRYAHLPAEASEIVARGIIDCVGVMILGFDQPVTRIVATQEAPTASGESSVLWGKARARADVAALINGTAAHALDFDDVALDGHPSAVLVPVILAVGERIGADGEHMVTAYVAGYEVWADLIARDRDRFHSKGLHPTAVFGTIAAAAAAASLQALNFEETRAALAIAASMSAGIVANFGTMTKPFQVGRAAQSGIIAARLAAAGMTAAGDAFEHPVGFLRAFSPAGEVDLERPPAFGRDWKILVHGLNIKLHPVCYGAHRIIDSAAAVAAKEVIDLTRIASVEAHVGAAQSAMLRSHRPRNALDAKFSAEFAVAAALIAGEVGLAQVSDAFVQRPDVQALMQRTRVISTDAVNPDEPMLSPADRVTVHLADGATIEGPTIRYALGHARNPAGPERLHRKFSDCCAESLSPGQVASLFEKLARPQELASVASLYARDSRR